MATAPISYGNEYSTDLNAIERNRKYAELLQQQSMQPSETNQMAGGWVIPTPKTAGLAKVLQGIGGIVGNRMADQKEKALSEKYQSDLQSTLSDAQKAYTGTPAMNTQPATPMDDQGNAMPQVNSPAVAGDPMKYASILMRHPATQAMGLQASQSALQSQQLAAIMNASGAPNAPASGAMDPQQSGGGGMAPQGGGSLMSQLSPADRAIAGIYMQKGDQAGLAKFVGERLAPHVTADGKAITTAGGRVQVLPGSVQAMQDFSNVQTPLQNQQMDQNAMQMYQAKNVDLPGYSKGVKIPGNAGNNNPGIPGMLGQLPSAFRRDIQRDMALNPGVKANVDIDPSQSPQVPGAMGAPAVYGPVPGNSSGSTPGSTPNPTPNPGMPQNGGPAPMAIAPDQQRQLNTEMSGKLNNLAGEELFSGYKTSQKAADTLSAINESRKAIAGGAYQGTGADSKTDVVKFANNVLGMNIDPTKASNSDYLRSTLGSQVLAQAKSLGTNPSNTDAKRIEDIVGNLGKDPTAMSQLLDWQEKMIRNQVGQHNANVEQTTKRGFSPPFDLRVSLPEAYVAPAQAAPQRRAADAVPVKRFNPATGKIE